MLPFLLGLLGASPVDSTRTIHLAVPLRQFRRIQVSTLQVDSINGVMAATRAGADLLVAGEGTPVFRHDLASGRLLGAVTREGDGPGETRSPRFLATLEGDSVFLYDQVHRRATVFRPGTFAPVRSTSVPGRNPSAVLPLRGRILVAAHLVPAEGVGFPLHEYTSAGKWLRSYGSRTAHLSNRPDEASYQLVAPASSPTGLWSVTVRGPVVLTHHDTLGRQRLRLTASAAAELPLGQPPVRSMRAGLWESAPGTIWLLTWVPDQRWEEGLVPVGPDMVHGREARAIGERAKLWDSVVEAVNTTTGKIEARLRVDGWISHLLPDGLIILEERTTNGELRVVVERLVLAGSNLPRR